MQEPIVNPEIPYNGSIEGNIQPGNMCRIQGVTHPNADRFNINFQTGPTPKPRDDTALHISVRLKQGYIARNSYESGAWGDEDGKGSLPIGPAQAFEILVLIDPDHFKVAVNGQHFCDFAHRIPYKSVSHLLINGDVSITLISWESAAAAAIAVSQTQASQLNSELPQQAQGQAPPFQGYGPPPPNYGPQGPYGPPPPGYGPPAPPGAEPQSGFDSFLEQAQTVLAGAIKTGAAEKLLGGLLSTGGQQQQQGQGYSPQNAQYGLYPQLPQDEFTKPKYTQDSQNPGIFSTLLVELLSGGKSNQQQYNPQTPAAPPQQQPQHPQQQPQHPQQQQQGTDLSSLLAGLLTGNSGNNQQNRNYGGAPPQPPPPNMQQAGHVQNPAEPNDVSDALANLIAGKGNNAPQQQNPQGGQQQAYGQYPSGPPPQYQPPQEQRGPLESLLSGFLSSGSTQPTHQQQQPHLPQVGGEGSIGGLGSMGGVLSNLAGQILHNPKQGGQNYN